MKSKKYFCLLAGLGLFVLANAQYSGIDIYTGVGLPLYSEQLYPDKNLFIPSNQPCPPVTRPGYFDKGSPNFTIGTLSGYAFRNWKIIGGINYTVYQIETWANPDSALKYAIPICPDPPVNNIQRYNYINLPVGLGYSLNKWQLTALYGIPIISRHFRQTSVVSGAEWGLGVANFWFYERASSYDPIPHYLQLMLGFNLTSAIQLVGFYQFNGSRFLNHLSIGIKYSFKYVQ